MVEQAKTRSAGRTAVLLACWALLLALGGPPPAAAAETTIVYTHESFPQYESQLAAGQIKAVGINEVVRSLHVTLDNGQHVLAHYAPKHEPAVAEALKAKGVPVTILVPAPEAAASSKPVHHKLRYIAGGILVAVIIIVGVVLFVNRRRRALAD